MYITSMRVYRVKNVYFCISAALPTLKRYIDKSDKVMLVCRVIEKSEAPKGHVRLPFEIEIIGAPDYLGFLKKEVRESLANAICESTVIMAHVPSLPSYLTTHLANKMRKNYCVVVVGCALEALYYHSLLGRLLAPINYLLMKHCVKKASYAIYVTERTLQQKYPCDCRWIHASNASIQSLDEEVLTKRLDKIASADSCHYVSLATCAAVDVKYKAQEDVIRALPRLRDEGIYAKYYLAGGGDQSYLKQIARKLAVENDVYFLGHLSKDEIIRLLDSIDIYIQPSKTEGLPRAVVEAMNRGCPCLGSDAGGIPELLESRYIFRRGSVDEICRKIRTILSDDLSSIAVRNFRESSKYLNVIIEKRRSDFIDNIIAHEVGLDSVSRNSLESEML